MDTWRRLSEICSQRFVARSRTESGWCGSGSGSVVAAQPDSNTIILTETGTWNPDAGTELAFSNVFRWSREGSSELIHLEHLRFGPRNPVYLFAMAPDKGGTWRSIKPYPCGDDLYSARMTVKQDQVELRWTVKGPGKDENIHYWYE